MNNKVVARFADGRVVKGSTNDIVPTKDRFHVTPADGGPGHRPVEIELNELKAVFFVKELAGNAAYQPSQEFEPGRVAPGRKVRVIFADGEVLVGTTQAYQPNRSGLFLVPADAASNIDRCYVVAKSTKEINLL